MMTLKKMQEVIHSPHPILKYRNIDSSVIAMLSPNPNNPSQSCDLSGTHLTREDINFHAGRKSPLHSYFVFSHLFSSTGTLIRLTCVEPPPQVSNQKTDREPQLLQEPQNRRVNLALRLRRCFCNDFGRGRNVAVVRHGGCWLTTVFIV